MKEYRREPISTVVSWINRNLLLPDIQRPFVWTEQQIYKLFDSLMRGYPISTFLFWELSIEKLESIEDHEKIKMKMYKFVDSNGKESEEEENRERDSYFLVLDGQQRLTSIFIALKGTWRKKAGKSTHELYFDTLSGNAEDEDGIQYKFQFMDKKAGTLKIDAENGDNSPAVWVNVKRFYEDDIGQAEKRYNFVARIIQSNAQLSESRSRLDINLNRLDDVLKKDGVINYFPENEPDYEKVLDIFVRTNSGGTKLGYSDLLFSKIKLHWIDAREKFKELLDSINIHNFEFDTDFLLKTCLTIFSNKSEEVRYSVSNLSNDLIRKIKDESQWKRISEAVQLTVELLDEFLITDKKQLPSYNALIPIVYWHFKKEKRGYGQDSDLDSHDLKTIRVWLTKAFLSGAFSGQSDTALYKCKEAIDNTASASFPAIDIQQNLKTMKNRSMDINEGVFDEYSYQSKESYLFLSLCYKMAIRFEPIPKRNLPEQDHIFSKDELKKAGVPDKKINSIYNIRYVRSIDNREKSSMPYSEWVTKKLGGNKEEVFKTHLIPDGEWSVERFDEFLAARRSEMMKQIEY